MIDEVMENELDDIDEVTEFAADKVNEAVELKERESICVCSLSQGPLKDEVFDEVRVLRKPPSSTSDSAGESLHILQPHDSTGHTPNFLVLGREVRTPPDIVYGNAEDEPDENYDSFVEKMREHSVAAFAEVRTNLQ